MSVDDHHDDALSPGDKFLIHSYFGTLTSQIIQTFVSAQGDINYSANKNFNFEGGYDANIYPGDTAVSIAFRRNFNKIVEILCSFGAKIPGEMICDASMFGNIDIVKKYVKEGGDINYETKLYTHRSNVFQSDTACSIAFRKNHANIVEYLLHCKAKLSGEMMIELAYQNNIRLVQYGLSIGSDINYQTQRNDSVSDVHSGDTMLIVALKCEHYDLIRALLTHREINCNIIGSAGKTALHHACAASNVPLVKSLIQKGADNTIRGSKFVKLAFALLNSASKPEVEEAYRLQCTWNRRRAFITVLVENGYLGATRGEPTNKIFNNTDIVRSIVSYI